MNSIGQSRRLSVYNLLDQLPKQDWLSILGIWQFFDMQSRNWPRFYFASLCCSSFWHQYCLSLWRTVESIPVQQVGSKIFLCNQSMKWSGFLVPKVDEFIKTQSFTHCQKIALTHFGCVSVSRSAWFELPAMVNNNNSSGKEEFGGRTVFSKTMWNDKKFCGCEKVWCN